MTVAQIKNLPTCGELEWDFAIPTDFCLRLYTPDNVSEQFGIKPLAAELRSAMVMPIIANSGPVGVFDFGSRHQSAFTPGEASMCSMLVDQMSYSLENIRLVNELSRSRDAVIRGMALLAEIRDIHIGGHLNRICAYAKYLAEQLLQQPGYAEVTPAFVDTIARREMAWHDKLWQETK